MCIEKGWITGECFNHWLLQVFIPLSGATPANPVMLIVDNHRSRFDPEVLQTIRAHGVEMVLLPPYATLFLQPLDVSNFSLLAKATDKIAAGMASDDENISRYNIMKAYQPAFETAFSVEANISGFLRTGLWPIDRNAISNIDQFLSVEVDSLAQRRRRDQQAMDDEAAAAAAGAGVPNNVDDDSKNEMIPQTMVAANGALNRSRASRRIPHVPPVPALLQRVMRYLPSVANILTPPIDNGKVVDRSSQIGWMTENDKNDHLRAREVAKRTKKPRKPRAKKPGKPRGKKKGASAAQAAVAEPTRRRLRPLAIDNDDEGTPAPPDYDPNHFLEGAISADVAAAVANASATAVLVGSQAAVLATMRRRRGIAGGRANNDNVSRSPSPASSSSLSVRDIASTSQRVAHNNMFVNGNARTLTVDKVVIGRAAASSSSLSSSTPRVPLHIASASSPRAAAVAPRWPPAPLPIAVVSLSSRQMPPPPPLLMTPPPPHNDGDSKRSSTPTPDVSENDDSSGESSDSSSSSSSDDNDDGDVDGEYASASVRPSITRKKARQNDTVTTRLGAKTRSMSRPHE